MSNSTKIILAMDIGSSPNKNYSRDYQSGSLSFEIISNGKKLINNSLKKSNLKKNKMWSRQTTGNLYHVSSPMNLKID